MKIRVINRDITRLTDVEAIVNEANSSLLGGGGEMAPYTELTNLRFWKNAGV